MHWADPQKLHWLWALVPVAALLVLAQYRYRTMLYRLVQAPVQHVVLRGTSQQRHRNALLLWMAAFLLLLLSLAGPQWGFHWQQVERRGLNILIALDVSKSMLATDFKPTRLQQAKWGIADLVRELHGDRIGLLVFAGTSHLICPLTFDYDAFMMLLDDVSVETIPRGGTAIENAIRHALRVLQKQSPDADRVLVLLTDGEDHEGNPLSTTSDLRKSGIKVFAVGVGTPEGDLIPLTDSNGNSYYLKDRNGNVVKSRLREDHLQRLAEATGGIYVRAAPGDIGLTRLYRQYISHLRSARLKSRRIKVYHHRYPLFIAAATVILVLEAALRLKRDTE